MPSRNTHNISYDIQGLKDEGVDVLLVEWVDSDKQSVGFQIKADVRVVEPEFAARFLSLTRSNAGLVDDRRCYRLWRFGCGAAVVNRSIHS